MIRVTLEYGGKNYTVVDELENTEDSWIWKWGNYSCDCNKSLFIIRQCDEKFPELGCGEEIKLVSIAKD